MKKWFLSLLMIVISVSLSASVFAGIYFGMAAAVKEKVKQLDEKVITGKFRFVNGATGVAASAAPRIRAKSVPARAPSIGIWQVSPDKVQFKVTDIIFERSNVRFGNAKLEGACSVTFDRSRGSNSVILDCPFKVREGAYTSVGLYLDNTFTMTIDDDADGIYTDPTSPTRLTSTRPTDGGQPVSFTASQAIGTNVFVFSDFDKPLVLGPNNTAPVIQLLMDGVQTTEINVDSGGELTFHDSCITCDLNGYDASGPPISITPFVSGIAREAVYAEGAAAALNTQDSAQPVRVFYDSGNSNSQPYIVTGADHVWHGACGSPEVVGGASSRSGTVLGSGAYLGRDNTGTIGGAASNGPGGTGFAVLFSFQEQTVVGSTTTFKYKCDNNPPAPTSGTDYSSGVPSFTPDGQVDLKLFLN